MFKKKQKKILIGLTNKFLFLAVLPFVLGVLPVFADNLSSDSEINVLVKSALLEDPRVPDNNVSVSTIDGIVELTGAVENLAAKKYADLEAQKIRGVRGVINKLQVEPLYRFDFDLAQDIRLRILNSSAVKTNRIDVKASGGVVTLSGVVADWAEANEAELLATETAGVKAVVNKLSIRFPKERSDDEIQKDVADSLARDVYLTGLPITVSVKDGIVTLTGEVGSVYQKQRARSDAIWIWNVKNVKNDLEVKWWDNAGTRLKIASPTNEQLSQAVTDEFYQDIQLDPLDIVVEADSGHVKLLGSVPTFYQKRIAEKDALDVVGTLWVTNLLDIKKVARSDKSILNDIQFNINMDYTLNPDIIHVKVDHGVVTLTGEASSFWEKVHAYDVASRINGVHDIINNIRVNYSAKYTDASILRRVKERLVANAETRWIANVINVSVSNGKVTLTGIVNFWSEYRTAENIAFSSDGVWAVDNKLHVLGYNYNYDESLYPWSLTYSDNTNYPPQVYDQWW